MMIRSLPWKTEASLVASGLIAGEALMGLLFAALAFMEVPVPNLWPASPFFLSIAVMFGLGYMLVKIPLGAVADGNE